MAMQIINPSKLPPSPYAAQSPEPTPAPTPSWVPWAIGAAVGGGVLYLLLRR